MTTESQAISLTEKLQDIRKTIKVRPDINERLEALMFGLGIKTRTEALERLLDEFAKENPELLRGNLSEV